MDKKATTKQYLRETTVLPVPRKTGMIPGVKAKPGMNNPIFFQIAVI